MRAKKHDVINKKQLNDWLEDIDNRWKEDELIPVQKDLLTRLLENSLFLLKNQKPTVTHCGNPFYKGMKVYEDD